MSQMEQIGRTTAQSLQSTFSNVFFDGMTGELKSFGDYFLSFWQSVVRAMSDMFAKELVKMMTQAESSGIWSFIISNVVGSLFGVGTGTGGASGGAYYTGGSYSLHQGGLIKRMHVGGLKRDEVPAILQTNEGVLSRRGMAALGVANLNALNSGRVPVNRQTEEKRPIILNITNVVDSALIASSRRSDSEIINVISADILKDGQTRQTIKKYL